MIREHHTTPTTTGNYICYNTIGERIMVAKELMMSLPFYADVEDKDIEMVDTNGQLTGVVFKRLDATKTYKKEEA